jgi:hypothetical protein
MMLIDRRNNNTDRIFDDVAALSPFPAFGAPWPLPPLKYVPRPTWDAISPRDFRLWKAR